MTTVETPSMQIVGLGASTPIGRNVWASAAAARAGVCGFSEHPFMIDTAGEPMRIARAPWLAVEIECLERYCELLFPALDEALGSMSGTVARTQQPLRLGLALALPPVRPGQSPTLAKDLLDRANERYPALFTSVFTFEAGHAAGHLALDAAVKGCGSGAIDACVVAGVDSYLSPETLEWVEACDQLHGGGLLNNAWGFVPGEGAGAVLLAPALFSQRLGLPSLGTLRAVGVGTETKLIKTDTVCIGEGLTQAFRAALKGLAPGERVDDVYCDLNGEPYRADEFGFAALRTGEHFRAASDFVAPADCWGDVGAAGAPLHLALALIASGKRYAKGPLAMVWGSSESGERGAVLLGGAEGAGG